MIVSKERCLVPCEVFGQRCWVEGRSSRFPVVSVGKGLMLMGSLCNPPKLLCSVPDLAGGYKLYPCPYVTPTGRVRKWTAYHTKLDDFRKSFIVRKIKKFIKEETEKLNAQREKKEKPWKRKNFLKGISLPSICIFIISIISCAIS